MMECQSINFFLFSHRFPKLEKLRIEPKRNRRLDEIGKRDKPKVFHHLNELEIVSEGDFLHKILQRSLNFPKLRKFTVQCDQFDLDNYFFFVDLKERNETQLDHINIVFKHIQHNSLWGKKIDSTLFIGDQQEEGTKIIKYLNFFIIKDHLKTRRIVNEAIFHLNVLGNDNSSNIKAFLQIFKFPNVKYLYLSGCAAEFGRNRIVQHFPNLFSLSICKIGFSDEFFRVNDFGMIEELTFSIIRKEDNLRGNRWKQLSSLKKLNIENIGESSLQNDLFETNYFPNLEELEIFNWKEKIGNNWIIFPKLLTILVVESYLSDEPFQNIVRFPKLEALSYFRPKKFDKNVEDHLLKGENWLFFPNLKRKRI